MRTDRIVVYLDNDVHPAWRWAYRASNGRILADGGESYKRRADCIKGLERVTGGTYTTTREGDAYLVRGDTLRIPVVIES